VKFLLEACLATPNTYQQHDPSKLQADLTTGLSGRRSPAIPADMRLVFQLLLDALREATTSDWTCSGAATNDSSSSASASAATSATTPWRCNHITNHGSTTCHQCQMSKWPTQAGSEVACRSSFQELGSSNCTFSCAKQVKQITGATATV